MQKMQIVITDKELELVKSAVLYDLYGQINRGDLKNVQNNLLGQEELALKRRTEL
jgi:dsRNA-specific ribonuclease